MAIALVQSAPVSANISGGSTSITVTFPATTTAGNLLVAVFGTGVTSGTKVTLSSITGAGPTTWRSAVINSSSTTLDAEIWWGVVDGTPGTVVTFNYNSNLTAGGFCQAFEYSGARTFSAAGQEPDQTITAQGTSTTASSGGATTNKGVAELNVGMVTVNQASALTGITNGYTQDTASAVVATGPAVMSGHLILDGVTYADPGVSWTAGSSVAWIGARASFFAPSFKEIVVVRQGVNRAATW